MVQELVLASYRGHRLPNLALEAQQLVFEITRPQSLGSANQQSLVQSTMTRLEISHIFERENKICKYPSICREEHLRESMPLFLGLVVL